MKLDQSEPFHLLVHGARVGHELQQEIKKLEEEVVERAWRCGCHITASMPGGRDVVEPCSDMMQMGNDFLLQISIAEDKKDQKHIEICDKS